MLNRATLTGRLTRNVDLRYTPSGVAVGNFTLAVDRSFTDKNGQRGADFISCVIWRKSAENFANFTHKGSLVGIDGRIQTRNYTNKQGQKVYVTEVVVDNFALLESRSQSQAQGIPNGPANSTQQPAPQNGQPVGNQNFGAQQPAGPAQHNPAPTHGQATPQKPSAGPKKPGNPKKDPFANSGNKKIDISDDDLPF